MRPNTKTRLARLACERGQAALELALVLPVLLLIVMGAIYLGRDFNFANDATQLAGEGARLAAVAKDPPETLNTYLLNRAQNQSKGFHDAITRVCIDFPDSGSPHTAGSAVRVRVRVDLGSFDLPLIGHKALTAERGATMRLEKDAPASYLTGSACPA